MFPSANRGKPCRKIIREKNGVRAAEKKRCGPIPPTSQKSPEFSERRTNPAIEAALYRHCCGQFRSDKRNRDAPEKRNQQMIKERDARTGSGDLRFQAERSPRGVGIHH